MRRRRKVLDEKEKQRNYEYRRKFAIAVADRAGFNASDVFRLLKIISEEINESLLKGIPVVLGNTGAFHMKAITNKQTGISTLQPDFTIRRGLKREATRQMDIDTILRNAKFITRFKLHALGEDMPALKAEPEYKWWMDQKSRPEAHVLALRNGLGHHGREAPKLPEPAPAPKPTGGLNLDALGDLLKPSSSGGPPDQSAD